MKRILFIKAVVVPCVIVAGAVAAQQSEPPRKSSLVEQVEQRLLQLDLSLRPKKGYEDEPWPELTAEDLELVIGGRRVPIRHVDRICSEQDPAENPVEEIADLDMPGQAASARTTTAVLQPPRGTYVFFFEHRHLTLQGQATALGMAEELIPELITGGRRGMVVSSGSRTIQSELTDDTEKLLETLREIQRDTGQWTEMTYAEGEIDRYAEIKGAPSPAAARGRVISFQAEEMRSAANRMERLAAVLASLADLEPPKVVLYFADTMRKNAGKHYESIGPREIGNSTMNLGAFAAAAFDKVTEDAGAFGARVYTIQAQGLVSLGMRESRVSRRPDGNVNTVRVNHAEETMAGMALETGGATFRGGLDRGSIAKVIRRIREDLDCLWLLSYVPDDLPRDSKLPVRARFNPDSPDAQELDRKFAVGARGQLVVQSESRRTESILLAAHLTQGSLDVERAHGSVIPLGYEDGRYRALVQLVVDPPLSVVDGLSWDLGLTHVWRNEAVSQIASRVELPDSTAPVILESVWDFRPGRSEIIGVGHEKRLGTVASARLELEWPDPDDAPVSIAKLAVVQSARGAFLRHAGEDDEQTRDRGTLGIGAGEVQTERPTALMALVCRGRRMKDELRIERVLIGGSAVDFPARAWPWNGGERCILIQDLVPEGSLGWGDFGYEVRVRGDTGAYKPLEVDARIDFTAARGR